jgi:DNA-binding CsgD family transcriptional regulator
LPLTEFNGFSQNAVARGVTKRSEKLTASPNAVLGQADGRLIVKTSRFARPFQQKREKDEKDSSNVFVFCEKTSGVAQFRAESDPNTDSLDRIAGLLAMQCLVRGQEPGDFQVLVPAQKIFEGRVVARARELLEEGRALACPATLSPRQKEILHSVLCNRANKEIASKLNITVRTVKFHISTLLTKFGVTNRGDLARRAAGFVGPAGAPVESAVERPPVENPSNGLRQKVLSPLPVMMNSSLRVTRKTGTGNSLFQSPILSA